MSASFLFRLYQTRAAVESSLHRGGRASVTSAELEEDQALLAYEQLSTSCDGTERECICERQSCESVETLKKRRRELEGSDRWHGQSHEQEATYGLASWSGRELTSYFNGEGVLAEPTRGARGDKGQDKANVQFSRPPHTRIAR